MFSSLSATAQSSSPATNPFAPKPQAPISNPFASIATTASSSAPNQDKRKGRANESSDNEGKRKGIQSFKDRELDLSDSGKSKGKQNNDKGRKVVEVKKNGVNGVAHPKKSSPFGNAGNSFGSSQPLSGPLPTHSDPHARKVYTQLHKDGISPPTWPSQPGEAGNAAAMSKFREQYESYRAKVRKSLEKAGIIDDPNVRRTLQDAIEFRGISEDMCPEFEKITRINESDVYQPEKDPKTGAAVTSKMIKKLARSAAGQEAPLPMDVRSVPTLKRTIDYLVDDLLQHDGNLPTLHGFLWDRTRAIRRDFTFFSTLTPEELKLQVYVLENIARFHVTSLHLLSRKDSKPEEFVEQQELEQLGKTLLSLRDLYDDCNAQGIVCENETHFRAYYLVFHAQDPNIMETLQRSWSPKFWKDSDEVRTAVSLVEALQNTKDFHGPLKEGPSMAASGAHHAYFRIVEDPSVSYTMACFAECHFASLRRSILRNITRALARPAGETKDVTAAALNNFLRFDTVDEAVDFAELHDLGFEADDASSDPSQYRLVLRKQALPHIRLTHHYSTMVENKRGKRSLPDVIHHTAPENSQREQSKAAEEGNLFVQNTTKAGASSTSPFPQSTQPTKIASSGFGQPSGPLNSAPSFNNTATQNSQPKPSAFGTPSTQTGPAASTNPFASSFTPQEDKTTPNSFGMPSQSSGASTFSGPSTSASTIKASGQKSDLQAVQPAKHNPFASLLQPQTNGILPSSGTLQAKKPAASAINAFSTAPEAAKPSPFSSTKPATQPAFPTSSNPTPASNLFPNAAPQKAPTMTSFTPPTSTQSSSSLSITATTTNKPVTASTLSPSPFAQSDSKNASGAVKSAGFDFNKSAPKETTPAGPVTSLFQPAQPTTQPKPTPLKAPEPPRDLMGDFTRWFVNGDGGLMEDFRVYMVDEILKEVYDKWIVEEEERKAKEEKDRIDAEVEAFRVYNLRVKYFYRWKNNARAKRLRAIRKSGREQLRAYYAAKREEEKEAARKAAEVSKHSVKPDRGKEISDLLKRKTVRRSDAEDELLASGVFSGVGNERELAARIVRKERGVDQRPPSRASSSGSTARRTGGKTQAIREQLLQKRTEGFRRSLPPGAARSITSTDSPRPVTNVSERWVLKGMGIVQMPDGTAVPASMARDMMNGGKQYPGLGKRPRASSLSTSERPLPPTSAARNERPSILSRSFGTDDPPAPNKRKRSGEDEVEVIDVDADANPNKRVMSESEKLVSELRAMREELEEGTSWFKQQTERLQSEVRSRGTTPWDDSI